MPELWRGLAALAVLMVLIVGGIVSYRMAVAPQRGSAARKDPAPRRSSPEGDATGDAVDPKPTLAARLDELDYRFTALKAAHEQLAESIGTRFATMGKRIQRATGEAVAEPAGDDPAQGDFLTAIGAVPPAPRPGAPHVKRLVPRFPSRR